MAHEEDWNFYRCNVNDRLSSVYVDLGLQSLAPIPALPTLRWLWIKLRFPDERGLSVDAEFDALCAYEDELCAALAAPGEIVFAGRITGAGRREFYFYTTEKFEFEKRIDRVVSDNREYKYQIGSKTDENWCQYADVLYPGVQGLKQIQARRETPS